MQYYLNKDWTSFRPNSEKISASQCEHFVSSLQDQARPKGKSKQSHVIFTWSPWMMSYQLNQKIVRVIQKLIVLIKVLWWIIDIIITKISEISRILFLLSFLDLMVIFYLSSGGRVISSAQTPTFSCSSIQNVRLWNRYFKINFKTIRKVYFYRIFVEFLTIDEFEW